MKDESKKMTGSLMATIWMMIVLSAVFVLTYAVIRMFPSPIIRSNRSWVGGGSSSSSWYCANRNAGRGAEYAARSAQYFSASGTVSDDTNINGAGGIPAENSFSDRIHDIGDTHDSTEKHSSPIVDTDKHVDKSKECNLASEFKEELHGTHFDGEGSTLKETHFEQIDESSKREENTFHASEEVPSMPMKAVYKEELNELDPRVAPEALAEEEAKSDLNRATSAQIDKIPREIVMDVDQNEIATFHDEQ